MPSTPSGSAPLGRSLRVQPTMPLPASRPTSRIATVPMRQVPLASTANPAPAHASAGSATTSSAMVTAMPPTLGPPDRLERRLLLLGGSRPPFDGDHDGHRSHDD